MVRQLPREYRQQLILSSLRVDPQPHGYNMIENMFNIPVVKYRCHNWSYKRQAFLDLLNEQTLTMGEESVYSDYGDYKTLTAEHSMGLYDTPDYLNTVRELLKEEMTWFANDLKADPQIVRAWFERALYKCHHPVHTHGHGGWSAVLFIEYDPTVHTPTVFIAPFNHFVTGMQLTYMPTVEEGDLILFPSFLLHYTQLNESHVQRTVASFNMTVDMNNIPLSWLTSDNMGDSKQTVIKPLSGL